MWLLYLFVPRNVVVSAIEAKYQDEGHNLGGDIKTVLENHPSLRTEHSWPDPASDELHEPAYVHPHNADTTTCTADCTELSEVQTVRVGRLKREYLRA